MPRPWRLMFQRVVLVVSSGFFNRPRNREGGREGLLSGWHQKKIRRKRKSRLPSSLRYVATRASVSPACVSDRSRVPADISRTACTALDGAMIIAVPVGSDVRPRSPFRRDVESNAVSRSSVTTWPVRRFCTAWRTPGARNNGVRKEAIVLEFLPSKVVSLVRSRFQPFHSYVRLTLSHR